MSVIGYALSSEEHGPRDLITNAQAAEAAGFAFALISDHYHPWIDRHPHSPFVWSVLGGIAQATERLMVGTGVTCPILRIHPAIIAQAAATTAALMPGRFFLGVGTGENLNEHVLGDAWPEWEVRVEMLEEAVDILRLLWSGDLVSHRGRYFTVQNARIHTLPADLPDIHVAASGPRMAEVAGRIGDGLIGTGPERAVVDAFVDAGGDGPRYGQLTVCWGRTAAAARRTAHEWWPTVALRGDVSQELPLPSQFTALASIVTEDMVADAIPCGPDPEPILAQIRAYLDAGYDHVYLHQVGPDQRGFIDFAERELIPVVQREGRPAVSAGA